MNGINVLKELCPNDNELIRHILCSILFFDAESVKQQALYTKQQIENSEAVPVRFTSNGHFYHQREVKRTTPGFKNKREAVQYTKDNPLFHKETNIRICFDKDGNYYPKQSILQYTGHRVSWGNLSTITNYTIYFLWFLLAFVSCNNQKQDPLILVEQGLKSFSDLGTVEYVVSKVVKADDDATWYKFGDRKILFSCKASLKAGIDLSELSKDSIKINESKKSILLVLPKAKLLSFNMKPDDIRLVYEKTAVTRFSFSNAERDMIMTQGEKDIRESIAELGILTDAEKNAGIFLDAFLSQAGYSEIDIQFSKNYLP